MTHPDSHWPEAVETLNEHGRAPVVLLCEHASNFIPAEYSGLGLTPPDLQRHIAWDIGAASVTRRLSSLLDAPAFLGNYSRLLIDLNRPLHTHSSIVTRSEATDIPGNASLTQAERARRTARIFTPFHEAVEQHLARRAAAGRASVIVAVHSFTPSFHGTPREWHAGILYDKAQAFAFATIDRLRQSGHGLKVDANVPYTVSPDEDYGLLVYGDNVGNPAILVEIRQDLLLRQEDQHAWAEKLATTLAIDVALGQSAQIRALR
jgi:predicted N-formylglutamate amidohydrolase